jgi:hypothetical protein
MVIMAEDPGIGSETISSSFRGRRGFITAEPGIQRLSMQKSEVTGSRIAASQRPE